MADISADKYDALEDCYYAYASIEELISAGLKCGEYDITALDVNPAHFTCLIKMVNENLRKTLDKKLPCEELAV